LVREPLLSLHQQLEIREAIVFFQLSLPLVVALVIPFLELHQALEGMEALAVAQVMAWMHLEVLLLQIKVMQAEVVQVLTVLHLLVVVVVAPEQ
jgi:hypothetical protein